MGRGACVERFQLETGLNTDVSDADLDAGRQTTGFAVELDGRYFAQVLIPVDITPAECERLANVVRQFLKEPEA
jgi:hypothetical protein